MAEIETGKFQNMVTTLGPENIARIATSGHDNQVCLKLKNLVINYYLLTLFHSSKTPDLIISQNICVNLLIMFYFSWRCCKPWDYSLHSSLTVQLLSTSSTLLKDLLVHCLLHSISWGNEKSWDKHGPFQAVDSFKKRFIFHLTFKYINSVFLRFRNNKPS